MCSYIVRKAALTGSAKGPKGWMRIDTANVYFDHPYHAPLDHALGIDFVNAAEGGHERVAVELSAQSARALVAQILAALESGEAEHGAEPASAHGASAHRAFSGKVESGFPSENATTRKN
ncbi:MAG TPA: DUF6295 family protein [Xanthobacteraceae bacterium]|nr:DUF6295 family protein [Xanthobacteraceae bacterium]